MMIFLFAPGLVNLVIILAIALREQFTFRRFVPMLDQIDAEINNRHLAEKRPDKGLRLQIAKCGQLDDAKAISSGK
jgi:hypothetical protein